jgi:hypothetical protein
MHLATKDEQGAENNVAAKFQASINLLILSLAVSVLSINSRQIETHVTHHCAERLPVELPDFTPRAAATRELIDKAGFVAAA